MKIFHALLFAAVALQLGCAGMKVDSEAESTYDFSAIKTYQRVEASAEILKADHTYLNENLHKALNNELAARGWKQVLNASNANVQASYHITLLQHEEYAASAERDHEFSGGLVYDRNDKSWSYGTRNPDLNVYVIEVGTLHVTLADVATGDRIWRGTLETRIDRAQPIEKQKELFAQIARKLMARIP